MKIKTSDLIGAALDWAVAIATGLKPEDIYVSNVGKDASLFRRLRDEDGNLNGRYMTGPDLLFSRKWEAAGPIIERERLCVGFKHQCDPEFCPIVDPDTICWSRTTAGGHLKHGPTPMIAAMRCFVASKLGDEVEVPKELLT